MLSSKLEWQYTKKNNVWIFKPKKNPIVIQLGLVSEATYVRHLYEMVKLIARQIFDAVFDVLLFIHSFEKCLNHSNFDQNIYDQKNIIHYLIYNQIQVAWNIEDWRLVRIAKQVQHFSFRKIVEGRVYVCVSA